MLFRVFRFLLTCGRTEEAEAILKQLSRENGVPLPEGKLIAHAEVSALNHCDM